MRPQFRKFDCDLVSKGAARSFSRSTILLAKTVTDTAELEVRFKRGVRTVSLTSAQAALIASQERVRLVSRAAAWRYQKVPLEGAARLLAFLESADEDAVVLEEVDPQQRDEVLVCAQHDLNNWRFERWLIARVMQRDPEIAGLLALLRTQETYGLIRFLLKERDGMASVAELSTQYGVSEPHFRRLCRGAFGHGLKRELRLWRAVTAVLEVVEGRARMTDVALNNGFSSSSHFSREIKDLFGVSPNKFKPRNQEVHKTISHE